jgi:general secretion pathway protein G
MLKNLFLNKRAGYSILEIMIVIGIIASLLVGVIQLAKTLSDRSKVEKVKTLLRAVKSGVDQFKIDLGKYPAKIDELVQPPSDAQDRRRWQGPYVPAEFAKDGSIKDEYGNDIEYKVDNAKNTFEVFSWGKNGVGSDTGNIFID